MSYTGVVTKISTKPHPNADRLLLGNCMGHQVVVGLGTEDGELGVFFPCDGQLTDEFCVANQLYPEFDETGKRVGGGFIDPKNRRVRAQRFRGEISQGLWLPVMSLKYALDIDKNNMGETVFKLLDLIVEGYEFTELNGHEICCKWINEATRNAGNNGERRASRSETAYLKMHPDTKHFLRNLEVFQPTDTLTITEKLHGTSGRSGWDWHTSKVPKYAWMKFLAELPVIGKWFTKEVSGWRFISGTRKVLIEDFNTYKGYYGDATFRQEIAEKIKAVLPKGYAVYYEIVGYTAKGKPIMPDASNSVLPEHLRKLYGDTTRFHYGQEDGTCECYVYAVTLSNEEGTRVQLPYTTFKHLCSSWGIKVVPYLGTYWGESVHGSLESFIKEESYSVLRPLSSTLSRHLREGCVVERFAADGTVTYYKYKLPEFYLLEDAAKTTDAVDMEELEEV